jgi:mono/diheme cytochrome c family protein
MCWTLLAALAALAAMAAPVAAQTVGDPAQGARLARQWCAHCHVVGPGIPGGDVAPPFASVARLSSTTALSLRVYLQTPHRRMPDWMLSRTETDDLIAYILSLRGE